MVELCYLFNDLAYYNKADLYRPLSTKKVQNDRMISYGFTLLGPTNNCSNNNNSYLSYLNIISLLQNTNEKCNEL